MAWRPCSPLGLKGCTVGREAICACTVGNERQEVKALLESTQLILRGALKRRYLTQALQNIEVVGDALRFQAGNEAVELRLGATEAAAWARKLRTPPPSLADKLGLRADVLAWVIGPLDDAALKAAATNLRAKAPGEAQLTIAVVASAAALAEARTAHENLPRSRHLWVVHAKGPDSALPDGEIRRLMRGAGYVDSKTTAVSAQLTATRYAKR